MILIRRKAGDVKLQSVEELEEVIKYLAEKASEQEKQNQEEK